MNPSIGSAFSGKRLDSDSVQLYAITNRSFFPSRKALLDCAASWTEGGMDYVQIREKDLGFTALSELAKEIVHEVRSGGKSTRILLNGPVELAIACGCDGVHLPSGLPPEAIEQAHEVLIKVVASPVVSVSCHTVSEIEQARDRGATLALFAPVFEKRIGGEEVPGQGLSALAAACHAAAPMPVFALGGVTTTNAADCIQAGAIGIAAIRLFASGEWWQLR